MYLPDIVILYHLFDETLQILQQLSFVVVAAVIATRIEWLHSTLHGAVLDRYHHVAAIVIFGLLAMIESHSGIPINVHEYLDIANVEDLPVNLAVALAIDDFRATMTLSAGLLGGPWVGLGTGLLVGIDHYFSTEHTAVASALAPPILGIYAGMVRLLRPECLKSIYYPFWVALIGTLIQVSIILGLVQPSSYAFALAWKVLASVGVANSFGCALLFWIILALDQGHEARLLATQSELRALRAQVDPHFLNNTLGDLNYLIRVDPVKARKYVGLLARFFKFTRRYADKNTITLAQEIFQVHRFLVLQRLELDDKLQYRVLVPKELRRIQVLPGSILTLVENAFKHGFIGRPPPYILDITAKTEDSNVLLIITNNGHCIDAKKLNLLGQCKVRSNIKEGGGVALYQLKRSLELLFGDVVQLQFSISHDRTMVILKHPQRIKK
jgi:LytS/YehU family sensor histidine kinase